MSEEMTKERLHKLFENIGRMWANAFHSARFGVFLSDLEQAESLARLGWEAKREIEGVLDLLPDQVRVHENGGPENIFATLAVSVAKSQKEMQQLRADAAMTKEGE